MKGENHCYDWTDLTYPIDHTIKTMAFAFSVPVLQFYQVFADIYPFISSVTEILAGYALKHDPNT